MKATVKCSSCGAEITNLNFSWGKRQWMFVLPITLIGFLPLWQLYKPKGDFRKDLQITVLEKQSIDRNYAILGTVENHGKTNWKGVTIDCLFFDGKGTFVDKVTGRLDAAVMPNSKEYFKVVSTDTEKKLSASDIKLEVKVADAYSNPF